MKITVELLKKYGADPSFIGYMDTNGLEGADLIEILDREDAPIEFLYFLRKYLKFDENENLKYNIRCKIDDSSTNIWQSQGVEESSNLMKSFFVKGSSNVRNSTGVTDSSFVFRSNGIVNSNEVARSKEVKDSDIVLDSEYVSTSERVTRSSQIDWCENVFLSENLKDCKFIYQSKNLVDSYFCGFMENSSHCLFCSGESGKEYCIFDEEVDPQTFSEVVEALREILDAEQSEMIEVYDGKFTAEERYGFSPRFDSIFNGLSKEFYGWVGTVPNFTEDKFLALFFNDRENLKKS